MKKRIIFFIFACFPALYTSAQSILKDLTNQRPGEGIVRIYQEASIANLVGKPAEVNATNGERKSIRTTGYRIQVYAGNNSRKAREEASEKGEKIKEYFPELPVYTYFTSPRWLCRVGDFKSIEEADATMRRIRATGVFKEASIVKEIINIHL